jgi:transcriptional regulator with XRE-family HTH domain
MSELTIKEKKEWAKLLFTQSSLSQKEIAAKVDTSEKTMSKWVNDEGWDTLRAAHTITKQQQLNRLYAQINELNVSIQEREEGKRFANNKEADTLVKLTAAAKNLEQEAGLSEAIETFMGFNDFLKAFDLKAAQLLAKYQDMYIQEKLKHA